MDTFYKHNFDYNTPRPPLEPEIVGQISQLEAKGNDANGDWGEIKDVANKNYVDSSDPSYSLKVRKITPVQNIGIENLKIKRSPNQGASTSVNNIRFDLAVNCWIRGVESYKTSRNHFGIYRSSHIEISGCYLHEAMGYGGGGWGYGVTLYASTTNSLVENNIFRKLRHAMVAGGGSNCNVWTFNYSRDQYSKWNGITYDDRDLELHAKYPFGHLFEHNYVEQIESDDYHGDNGPYNTFVRNLASERQAHFETMHDFSTLGNHGKVNNSLIPMVHSSDHDPAVDFYGFTDNYYYGWNHYGAWYYGLGNVSRLNDISYYYSSKPAFLSGYTWPALGTQTTTSGVLSNSIPARARYNQSVKTYNAQPTYVPGPPLTVSISGPSSAPCATGTWTGLVSNGKAPYTYQWYQKWTCGGGPGGPEVPCDTWTAIGTNSPTLQHYWCGGNGKLRVDVTDGYGRTASDEHTVWGSSNKIAADQGDDADKLPTAFSLAQNYPNPFNPDTRISFALPTATNVKLVVFDMLGREVNRIVDTEMAAGYHSTIWNGLDNNGKQVASGVYIYQIVAGDFIARKKLTLLQ